VSKTIDMQFGKRSIILHSSFYQCRSFPGHVTLMENNCQDPLAGHRSHHGWFGAFIEYKLDAIMMTKNQRQRSFKCSLLSVDGIFMTSNPRSATDCPTASPLTRRAQGSGHLKDVGPWEKGFYLSGLCAPYDCKVAIL